MNILFIFEVDYIRKVVYDMHMLAEAMSLRGHKIYAIDYESMWERNGLGTLKTVETKGVSRALANSSVDLIRPGFVKIPILSRVTAFVTHYNAIKKTIKEKKIDAIILYSVPTNGLQAIQLAREYDVPIVFRSIDALHQLVAYPVLRSVTKIMEKKVYSSVDKVLTLTPRLSEYVCGLGARCNDVYVLPMTVDTQMFYPRNDNGNLRQMWGIDTQDKVILFMGTLFNFSGLDGFIQVLPEIIRQIPETKLLIVGDGQQRKHLEKLIDKAGLRGKVIITGFQPYSDMVWYINTADVCINPFLENDVTRDIFPGKTVQFLACGKPLVNTPLPGVQSMISGVSKGVVYTKQPDEMAEAVTAILRFPKWKKVLGLAGLSYAVETHSCDTVGRKLERILKGLRR